MKIYKWCEPKMKSEYSSYKGSWVRTHQAFLRPGDIIFVDDLDESQEQHHFEVTSMPYEVPHLAGGKEWSIDLEPIEWKGK